MFKSSGKSHGAAGNPPARKVRSQWYFLLLFLLLGTNLPFTALAQTEQTGAGTPPTTPTANPEQNQHLYLPVVATQNEVTAGLISAANYGSGSGGGGGAEGRTDCPNPVGQLTLPKADDETFVGYQKTFLGQQAAPTCVCRNQGPIDIALPVTRYIGEVSPVPFDGNSIVPPFFGPLVDLPTLLQNQVIAPNATLKIAVWDIDSEQGEINSVSLNGYPLTTPDYIQGGDREWNVMSYEVPIEHLYFPLYRGSSGLLQSGLPVPATNRLLIDVDTENTGWCMAADWASLHIEAMAPVLFVHGTNAEPSTWNGVVDYLTTNRIPFDRDIVLGANDSIENNARELTTVVYAKAQSFGAQSVHLITHSKGGLDSRRYLSDKYHPEQVRVLSLNTLAGAHQGIVLADIMTAHHERGAWAWPDADPEIFQFLQTYNPMDFASIGPDFPAVADQRTSEMAKFNRVNFIPEEIKFYTYSADADINNDGLIDTTETEGLLPFPYISRFQADIAYHILRTTSGIDVREVPLV